MREGLGWILVFVAVGASAVFVVVVLKIFEGTRLGSFLGPPWVSEPERFPDEPVLAEFTGFWARVYVTENWLLMRVFARDYALKHAEIADVQAGFDPSPHDDGGPVWGIWITMMNGKEHGVGLFQAREAGDLIRSLVSAARR